MLMQTDNDAYNVANAVGHLVDLGGRMRSSSFGFKEEDVSNIDLIIEAINELENQRSVLHDQLEAESIKSSILRHELKFLPQKYSQEIHDAVVNARQSNSDLVQNLNAQLTNIEAHIVELTARNEYLETDNTVQLPERDRLRVQHEQVITVLNQRMAEKATEQIKLNETRDRLRGTHAKIMDREDDLLQLKEDMIKERADVRGEKARLRASINEAKSKTAAQNKENSESKSQLDLLLKRLDFTEKELDDLRKFIYKSETGRAKAEGQERALTNQINKQLRDNDNLRKNILDLQRRKIETEQKYKADIEAMQKHVEQLKAQIKAKEQRHKKLKVRREDLVTDADVVMEKRVSSQTQVAELTEILKDAKRALVRKQEEIARMREETTRMEQEMVELGDTHVVCVENFNRQIEEYRDQLGKERKDRLEVQQQRDSVQKNLEEFKVDNNRFMATVNKKVTQGKQKHENLTHEGTDLQRGLRELDDKIRDTKVEVREERLNYDLKKTEIENHLAALKNEIKKYEEMTKEAQDLLDNKIPEFANQTQEYNEAQVEFEQIKKQVSGMKSQKASLEDQVKRTRLAVDKAVKPQGELKNEVQEYRKTLLDDMSVQLKEAEELERQVYVVGTKLQTIADENQRFTDGNEQMTAEMEHLRRDAIDCGDDIEQLRTEYAFLKSLLVMAWSEDSSREQEMTDRDLEVLKKLAAVLEIASKRTTVVSHVSENMNTELQSLSVFLDSVVERRPKAVTERLQSGVNTTGQTSQEAASQPSDHFLQRQKTFDEYGIIVPQVRQSSTDTANIQATETKPSKSSPKALRKTGGTLNRKDPLPPIAQGSGPTHSRLATSRHAIDLTRDSLAPSDIDIDVDDAD